MDEDISISPVPHHTREASTASTPSRASQASQAATPRLGDFSRLHTSSLTYTPEHKPVSLGNFSKIFAGLTPSKVPTTPSNITETQDGRQSPSVDQASVQSYASIDFPESLTFIRDALRRKLFVSLTPPNTDSELDDNGKTDTEGYLSNSTEITPPSSLERDPPPIANLAQVKQHGLEVPGASRATTPPPQLQSILSYQFNKYGPLTTIYDEPRSAANQHQSMTVSLIPHRAVDAVLATCFPSVVDNGVHVFLDMSNINISFQQALRNRYKLVENARFVPLPQLNLSFLTEILVRGREVNVLNAGCSVQPGRSEPLFVRDLRNLDYHVDLRERKRTEEPARTPQKGLYSHYSSSDETSLRKQIRYVEDLVDETLQTRIAESVMEHFSTPGTLIIATGDAKPAKYSDGFFTYADRALKMGWHVEVVSWRTSLSYSWRNPEWTAQWGDRFRVIELDDFLDELLTLSE